MNVAMGTCVKNRFTIPNRTMDLKHTLTRVTGLMDSRQLDSEAQVKQSVIIPILRALGWDDTDPRMVKPEYKVDHGFVDYALLDHGRPHVFIEAKRIGAQLASGEEQLFRYAANRGVPLLILTDGQRWDFYLSMAQGDPKDRQFFDMELSSKMEMSDHAGRLEDFVQRENVIFGRSRRSAEDILEARRLRERTRKAIPHAWNQLLQEPDSQLVPMVSERVAAICGSAPHLDDVKSFLGSPTPTDDPPKVDPPPVVVPMKTSRIVGFEFRGKVRRTKTGIGALVEIVQLFDSRNPQFMSRLEARTTGRKRKLVARNRSDLYSLTHLVEKYSVDLKNGWWLGSNMSTSMITKRIQTACDVADVKFGIELVLIERDPQ